eukprot:7885533-Ditylum_brightwellii.AAC.1
MPNRQEPVTLDMLKILTKLAENEQDDHFLAAVRDWLILGSYTGYRLSEWAQERRHARKGTYAIWDKNKGGDGSVKAFIMGDLQFM